MPPQAAAAITARGASAVLHLRLPGATRKSSDDYDDTYAVR